MSRSPSPIPASIAFAPTPPRARAKGMSEAELGELLAIVGMASETNRLATALQVPVDEAFAAPLAGRPDTTSG